MQNVGFSQIQLHVHVGEREGEGEGEGEREREKTFCISTQGKEVAVQIQVLSTGSVLFHTVSEDVFQGAVKTPVIRSFTHGRGKEPEPIPGEVVYQSENG